MQMKTIREAQHRLPELVEEARERVIGLTNEAGDLVGLLAGVTEDDLDDLLVETPGFQAMLARARASIQAGRLVSGDEVLEEMQARVAREQTQTWATGQQDVTPHGALSAEEGDGSP